MPAPKYLKRNVKIFSTGNHIDSDGKPFDCDEAKLDKIIESTKKFPSKAVPFVLNHPRNDLPIVGYFSSDNIRKVSQDGKHFIEATWDQVMDGVTGLFSAGFKDFSVALRDDLSIRHVGFVNKGAVALPNAWQFSKFNEGEFKSINFEEGEKYFGSWPMMGIGRLFQNLREFIIDKYGVEAADKVMPSWEVDSLKEYEPKEGDKHKLFSTNIHTETKTQGDNMDDKQFQQLTSTMDALNESVKTMSATIKTLTDSHAQFSARMDAVEKQYGSIVDQNQELAFSSFVNGLIRNEKGEGRILPHEVPHIMALLKSAAKDTQKFEFSSPDGKKTELSAVDHLKQALMSRPVLVVYDKEDVQFGQGTTGNNGKDAAVDEFVKMMDKFVGVQ